MKKFLQAANSFRDCAIVDDDFLKLRDRFDGMLKRLTNTLPEIVCFCGSTRFTKEMLLVKWEYEKKGIIVLTWNVLPGCYEAHIGERDGVKEQIDELHKRKIDLSDKVFVINIDGYIGESTASEIAYARSIGVPVSYLEAKDETIC